MFRAKGGVQAGLGREVNCLKDQVDILRESNHSYARHEQVILDSKKEEEMVRIFLCRSWLRSGAGCLTSNWRGRTSQRCFADRRDDSQITYIYLTTILFFQNPNRTLMSLESETNLSSAGLGLEAPTTLEQVSSSMYLSK